MSQRSVEHRLTRLEVLQYLQTAGLAYLVLIVTGRMILPFFGITFLP